MLTNVYQCLPSPQQLDQAIIPLQFHHGYSWIDLVDCFIMLIDPRIDIHELWKIKEIYEIYEYQHYNLSFQKYIWSQGKPWIFLAQDFSVEIIWPPSGSPKIYSWLWNPWMKMADDSRWEKYSPDHGDAVQFAMLSYQIYI